MLKGRLSLFAGATSATIAIEFALVLPGLLLVWMYLVDFSRASNEYRRTIRYGDTVASLVAQQPTSTQLSPATLASILDTGPVLMSPFPASRLMTVVSALKLTTRLDGTCCDATVAWTYARAANLRPCRVAIQQVDSSVAPAPTNIAAGIIDDLTIASGSSQLIVVDVADTYHSLFSSIDTMFFKGFRRTYYAFPRASGELALSGPIPANGDFDAVC